MKPTREDVIEGRLKDLRALGGEYSKAKSEVTYLEEFKKSKLAILMKQYDAMGFKSAAAQEREARADDEYIQLLDGLREAVEKAEYARWQLVTAQLGAEVWRSLEASRRAENFSTGYSGDHLGS